MIPTKAYILRVNDPISIEYSLTAAESCDKIGLPYEFHEGVTNKSSYDAWMNSGIELKAGSHEHKRNNMSINKAACATVGHAQIWKKIADNKECAVILEHDALMLQSVNELDIPDDVMVVLGYKLEDPSKYDHMKAGKPTRIYNIGAHEGAHAYAITAKTAIALLQEYKDKGTQGVIDNTHFLKGRNTKIPLHIADPTPAIGWLRKSTIWDKSASKNYVFIDSFKQNLQK